MDYFEMRTKLNFKNAKVRVIGKSVMGLPIYCVIFDFGAKNNFVITASIHARENITTNLAILIAKKIDFEFFSLKNEQMPNIIIVPMVNPDGVCVCYSQVKNVSKFYSEQIVRLIKNERQNLFKANIRGVDLNNNFNALFNTDPALKQAPASSGFAGYFFESEPETRALVNLLKETMPAFTISLHSKGEEIYYYFQLKHKDKLKHKKVANIFSDMLNYKLVDSPTLSCGGMKDYCVSVLKIPSITIEVGDDNLIHPILTRDLQNIAVRFKNFLEAIKRANEEIDRKF